MCYTETAFTLSILILEEELTSLIRTTPWYLALIALFLSLPDRRAILPPALTHLQLIESVFAL